MQKNWFELKHYFETINLIEENNTNVRGSEYIKITLIC